MLDVGLYCIVLYWVVLCVGLIALVFGLCCVVLCVVVLRCVCVVL